MGKLNLTGRTVEVDGKWGFQVTLENEGGKSSTQSSCFVFDSSEEASSMLHRTLEKVLGQLDEKGVRIVAAHEGYQQ